MNYNVIIGLEIHAELKTRSKMFCSCDNDAEEKEPNTTVCPICLGHPGTLPLANKKAIEWLVLLGLGLDCQINKFSKFDRKNYFYPDLPKGYQISQYDLPFCFDGKMDVDGETIPITRIHMEEDTGKLTHPKGKNYSLVDFNRGGTPLIEMVTEPVIKSAEQAKRFCQIYQQILRYLQISDADMEKGQMRCEANVSVQEKGKWKYKGNCEIVPVGDYKLNPKVELKNINSFKAMERAVEYEIKRQIKKLEAGEKLIQETRGWNENSGKTVHQRTKEGSADYRYFPEPDIPPIEITDEWLSKIKKDLIELPPQKKKRFIEQYDFSDEIAEIIITEKDLADYTEKVISELRDWIKNIGKDFEKNSPKLAKMSGDWLVSKLFKHLKEDGLKISDLKITPENFAELITLLFEDKLSSSGGQKVLEKMYETGGDPSHIMADLDLGQMDNDEELEKIIKDILVKFPDQVEAYKSGKEALLQFFVGQVMGATKGKANPQKAMEMVKQLIIKN